VSDLFDPDADDDGDDDRALEALEREAAARRLVEALIFASADPVGEEQLALELPGDVDLSAILARLEADYAGRGVELVRVAGKWQFRTAADLAARLSREVSEPRRLGRAALETLAIIAYRQPVTRGDIEDIRGVAVSPNILKTLESRGWIDAVGHRDAPGRPALYATTRKFLDDLGLRSLSELPPLAEIERMIDAQPDETPQAAIGSVTEAPPEPSGFSREGNDAADDLPAQSDAFSAPEQAAQAN